MELRKNVRIIILRKSILFMNPLIVIASFAFFIVSVLNLTLFFLLWFLFSMTLVLKICLLPKRNLDFFGNPWEIDALSFRVSMVFPG